ncbi:MAG: (d)CMP kinase [Aquincola sp.]|nr:(d)CMP kinase [Aquincola sp.]
MDGDVDAGSTGGTDSPTGTSPSRISAITLPAGANSTANNFAEILPVAISGRVYLDADNDGVIDAGETGVGGQVIRITGTDDRGQPVTVDVTTQPDGHLQRAVAASGHVHRHRADPAHGHGQRSHGAGQHRLHRHRQVLPGHLLASRISGLAGVRTALQDLQLAFRRAPGLVADGRDMGTVIFPTAPLKVYLTASAATRAERRHKQLISKGIPASIADLRADLEARDARDKNRAVAPLKPAEDAYLLDNSNLSVDESVQQVLSWWQARRPF